MTIPLHKVYAYILSLSYIGYSLMFPHRFVVSYKINLVAHLFELFVHVLETIRYVFNAISWEEVLGFVSQQSIIY